DCTSHLAGRAECQSGIGESAEQGILRRSIYLIRLPRGRNVAHRRRPGADPDLQRDPSLGNA
ncbi:MAG: hypothetical protein ACI378_07190, partial [Bacteroides sp.]